MVSVAASVDYNGRALVWTCCYSQTVTASCVFLPLQAVAPVMYQFSQLIYNYSLKAQAPIIDPPPDAFIHI